MNRACAALLIGFAVSVGHAQPSTKPAKPASPAARTDLTPWVRSQVQAVLKKAGTDGSLDQAAGDAQLLFDQVIAYAPDSAALADADFAVRLLTQLQSVSSESRTPLLKFLADHEDLARTLAFLVRPQDSVQDVYAILGRLHAACGEQVAQFPALAAAICVVYDAPVLARASMRPNEKARQIDPVEVFKYYAANDSKMVFGPRTLPAELLIYMVDSTAETGELNWALAHHAGDRNVGKRYNDVVYDTAALKYDKPKKIDSLPYTLENIRQVGGVCEEQAYYASNVGKAIGVPSVLITGRDSVMAHAWDGLLVSRGGGYGWVLDEGCFGDYKKLKGSIRDPQTGQMIASQELNLLAQSVSVPQKDREAAIACADAARRIAAAAARSSGDWPPKAPELLEGATAKPAEMSAAMAFLERAVKLAPTSTAVWSGLAPMAKDMPAADRTRWAEALMRACEASPDFVHRLMGTMIAGLDDPKARAQAWAWTASHDQRRADLRVLALISQGAALEKAGDNAGAYACYQEVAEKLINDAPEAIDALVRAEALLKSSGKATSAIDLYADSFRRVARPGNSSPAAFRQSNFYRIGARYAKLLEDAGRGNEARNVKAQLKQGEEKDKGQ
jgi:hypothetical protein